MKTRIIHQEFEPPRTQRGIAATKLHFFTTEAQRSGAEGINVQTSVSLAKRVVIIKNLMIIVAATLLLAGCKYPEPAKVEQKDLRPAIGVSGAPKDALLFVDGLQMGAVRRYDGDEGVLLVESGKHRVEVRTPGGETLFSEEIFLSGSTIKIIEYKP